MIISINLNCGTIFTVRARSEFYDWSHCEFLSALSSATYAGSSENSASMASSSFFTFIASSDDSWLSFTS